jgi:tRNA U38,U39,U40 pseudouridine synthase TruA
MKLRFSQQIFGKFSNIKFHENPSSGSRVVPCGRTDRRLDMTKQTVAFAILRTRLKTGHAVNNYATNNSQKITEWNLIYRKSNFTVPRFSSATPNIRRNTL